MRQSPHRLTSHAAQVSDAFGCLRTCADNRSRPQRYMDELVLADCELSILLSSMFMISTGEGSQLLTPTCLLGTLRVQACWLPLHRRRRTGRLSSGARPRPPTPQHCCTGSCTPAQARARGAPAATSNCTPWQLLHVWRFDSACKWIPGQGHDPLKVECAVACVQVTWSGSMLRARCA